MLAACEDRRRHTSAAGPYADLVAQNIPKIERATGLKFKTLPKVESRTRAEMHDFLLKLLAETNRPEQVQREEMAYKLFGLIPDTLKLQSFMVALLTEQVAGLYDPHTKTLYIVKDAPEDLLDVAVTHELVHALQDQYVNLDSIERYTGNSDRQSAGQAVAEGGATYYGILVAVGRENMATTMPGGLDSFRESIREAQASMPLFSNAPMAIQEALLFPYLSGFEFIRRAEQHGMAKTVFDSMPTSSEQILHEYAYFAPKRDEPSDVILPPSRDSGDDETMGEFGTRLFLYQHLKNNTDAVSAAQGWDGDRYRVVKTAKGPALAWVSVWDNPSEAAQFVDELGQAIGKRYHTSAPTISASGVRTYAGAGRNVVITPLEISGRAVVMYADVPAGASPALLPEGRIVVRPH